MPALWSPLYLQIPLFSLGGFWLQRTNEFTIPCYFSLGIDECGDS